MLTFMSDTTGVLTIYNMRRQAQGGKLTPKENVKMIGKPKQAWRRSEEENLKAAGVK